MADRQKQLRENMEQMSNIKKELRQVPHLEVVEKIGSGSFGDIFKVWDSRRGTWAALKFEKKDKRSKMSLIKKEAQIMHVMKGSKYFARLLDSRFSDSSIYSFIEMTYLGPNLESLKKRMPQAKFSLRSVLLIANQMLSGMQAMHENGIIHRDIKPENFVIGIESNQHQVVIIDFGLSKYFLEDGGRHIPMKQNKGLVGTARYTSTNSHAGFEQSRRDDLESIAYLLIYFASGSLLWQNLQYKDKEERFKKIAELKTTTPIEQMCKGLPSEFNQFLQLVKQLGFEEVPDYIRYRALFSQCYAKQNYSTTEEKSCYDWCPKNCSLQAKQLSQSRNISALSINDGLSVISSYQKEQHGLTPSAFKSGSKIQNTTTSSQILQGNATTLQSSMHIAGEKKPSGFNNNNTTTNGAALFQRAFSNQDNLHSSQSMAINLGQSGTYHNQFGKSPFTSKLAEQQQQAEIENNAKLSQSKREFIDWQVMQKQRNAGTRELYDETHRRNWNEVAEGVQCEETEGNEDIPVSELKKEDGKLVPEFRTENNFAKHQSVSIQMVQGKSSQTQRGVVLAQQQQQQQLRVQKKIPQLSLSFMDTPQMVTTTLQTEASCRNEIPYYTPNNMNNPTQSFNLFPPQMSMQLSMQQNQHQQQPYQSLQSTPKCWMHSPRDPFKSIAVLNKESSQYVHQDESNEWSSSQDENVQIQSIVPFHPARIKFLN